MGDTGYDERLRLVALDVGALSEDEHRSWTEDFAELAASGMFVAGITHLFEMGRKSR